ncbi:hypothetical protein ACM26V_16935 [Salipaludibacillus sp. HK11]|uniref:hypothetical protein n=1 Tax=Salipaludibacillus sp. HK11 TaxID=3394320 RepID=UPI0039FD2155
MERFTLEEIIMKLGSEGMIKQFISKKETSKKKKGSVDGKYTKQLMEKLDCKWTSITVEGKGAERIFLCEGIREVEKERQDGRKNNGAVIPYEYEINSLVLDYILKKQPKSMSLNKWLNETELADISFTTAYHNGFARKNHFESLKEKDESITDQDYVMLEHFIKTEVNTLKGNIKSVFKKLERAKIIMHTVEMMGCTSQKEHRKITDEEMIQIGLIKRELFAKHNLEPSELYKDKDERVIDYWTDYKIRLKNELELLYIYESHGCFLQAKDETIETYLDNLVEDELFFCYGLSEINMIMMVSNFKNYYHDNSIKRAESRQRNVANRCDHSWINQRKVLEEYAPMWEKLLNFYKL